MFGAVGFAAIEPELFRPLKRAEYDRLVELGLFQGERIELLRGVLVKMLPQRPPHASTVQKLNGLLAARLQERFGLRIRCPLALSDDSEPEPDVAIVSPGDYDTEHPRTALLVIEVADSSQPIDRGIKLTIYAEADVPEYWIVDLVQMTVDVHTQPKRGRYTNLRTFRDGDVLRPTLLPDVAIYVAEIPR